MRFYCGMCEESVRVGEGSDQQRVWLAPERRTSMSSAGQEGNLAGVAFILALAAVINCNFACEH